MLPSLLATEDAARVDMAAMILVVKKMDPSFPSSM